MQGFNLIKKTGILGFIWLISIVQIVAQCPMCKAAAESNLKNGGTAGMGLNAGIIYLFLTPFTIIATLTIAWFWTNHRNKKKEIAEIEIEREKAVVV